MIFENVELALVVTSLFVSILGALLLALVKKSLHDAFVFFLFFAALSLTGAGVGYLAGLSRVGVAGDVLPAAMVFLGAGVASIFSLDRKKGLVAAIGIGCFSAALFHSYYRSAELRSEGERKVYSTELTVREHFLTQEACLEFILSKDYFELEESDKLLVYQICSQFIKPGSLPSPKRPSLFD